MKQTNKQLRITLPLAAIASLAIATGSTGAATIAHVGNDIDFGADFTSLSNSVGDLDGDGIVGTDGYYFPATSNIDGTPNGNIYSEASYINNFSATNVDFELDKYPKFVGPDGVERLTGTTTDNPSQVLFSFEFTSDVPATVGLSIFVDAIDHANWASKEVTINVTGDTISYTSPSNNGDHGDRQLAVHADLLHFQITGAVAGDVVSIYANGAERDGNQATLQGFALESVAVPEPTTTALLGIGGIALTLRRRK